MKQLLNPYQISELLQVKLSTVYKWTHYGFIPHVKISGVIRFDKAEVANWLTKRTRRGIKSYYVDFK